MSTSARAGLEVVGLYSIPCLELLMRLCPLSIAMKKMCSVVLAAGQQWAKKVVQFVADNEAVVEVIRIIKVRIISLDCGYFLPPNTTLTLKINASVSVFLAV